MAVRIVVGAQWGDEGKGKVVDVLSEGAQVVARYQGGPNAGHTIVVNGRGFVLHLLPSGILRPGKVCVVGNGVVLDPRVFFGELDQLARAGISTEGRLFVSDRAHVITRAHLVTESAEEDSVAGGRLGTTRRGVGPAYRDKVGRVGLRVGDLVEGAGLEEKVGRALEVAGCAAGGRGKDLPSRHALAEELRSFGERLKPLVADVSVLIQGALDRGEEVLAEGAQGTLLDVDHGTYPYVTSSSSVAGGACTGLGIGPTAVTEVVGVAKAYCTRVGKGPFPSELPAELADALREAGEEYGSTTGRPRRCGWFDAVGVRHSARVNGLSSLAITKLDVLSSLDEIRLCTGYELDGVRTSSFPAVTEALERCRPQYETVPGWRTAVSNARTLGDLPPAARSYLERLAGLVGVPISMVSVGSGREQTISVPVGSFC